jgi:VanZ family protein
MGLIFWSSSRLRPEALSETPDYWLHGGAYFVLAVLAIRAVAKGLAGPPSTLALVSGFAIAVLYGLSDEWHQSFVPGRDANVADLGFDAAGAFAGAALVGSFWRIRGAKRVY